MKKNYSKPAIIYDSFELSENIASNCDVIANNDNPNVCTIELTFAGGNMTVFGNKDCDININQTPSADDEICYHSFVGYSTHSS